jgi:hypothetical protein
MAPFFLLFLLSRPAPPPSARLGAPSKKRARLSGARHSPRRATAGGTPSASLEVDFPQRPAASEGPELSAVPQRFPLAAAGPVCTSSLFRARCCGGPPVGEFPTGWRIRSRPRESLVIPKRPPRVDCPDCRNQGTTSAGNCRHKPHESRDHHESCFPLAQPNVCPDCGLRVCRGCRHRGLPLHDLRSHGRSLLSSARLPSDTDASSVPGVSSHRTGWPELPPRSGSHCPLSLQAHSESPIRGIPCAATASSTKMRPLSSISLRSAGNNTFPLKSKW